MGIDKKGDRIDQCGCQLSHWPISFCGFGFVIFALSFFGLGMIFGAIISR